MSIPGKSSSLKSLEKLGISIEDNLRYEPIFDSDCEY